MEQFLEYFEVLDDEGDLVLASCGDVGECPAGFSPDGLLLVAKEDTELVEDSLLEDVACLLVVSRDDVAQNSQGGDEDGQERVVQKSDQGGYRSRVDNSL